MQGDRTEAKKNWLDQHDSLQEELLRMKREMAVKLEVQPFKVDEGGTAAEEPAPAPEEAIPAMEVPQEDAAQPPTKERSIRDLISAGDDTGKTGPEAEDASPALPRHPELTSYIAKVMQHESKIKRKKFEREKVSKPRAEITPPQKAGQDPGPELKEEAPPQNTMPETTISTETIETPADPVGSPEEASVPKALYTTSEPVQEQLTAPSGPIHEVVPPQTVPLTVEGPASPALQRDEAYERPRQMVRDRRKKSEKKGFISRIKRLLGKR